MFLQNAPVFGNLPPVFEPHGSRHKQNQDQSRDFGYRRCDILLFKTLWSGRFPRPDENTRISVNPVLSSPPWFEVKPALACKRMSLFLSGNKHNTGRKSASPLDGALHRRCVHDAVSTSCVCPWRREVLMASCNGGVEYGKNTRW